jgi:uncharacterized protein (TIGR01777 family)
MNVLVTGATGFIGKKLCETLCETGHSIVALTRNPDAARSRLPEGARVFPWNPTESQPTLEAFDGVDAVVNLAGESVASRWTARTKQAIMDSRKLSTRHLVDAMAALGSPPPVMVSASAIGYYRDQGDQIITETGEAADGFLAGVCKAWETEAERAEKFGVRLVRLRIGIVLGKGGGALDAMMPAFKFGLGGPLGSGRQWWSWIHIYDVVGAIAFAITSDSLTGPVNATAPAPVRQREFASTLATTIHRPCFIPTPAFALRLAAGQFASELLASTRVLPQRLQDAGYSFRLPHIEDALQQVLTGNQSD